jgi:hypothetical protein
MSNELRNQSFLFPAVEKKKGVPWNAPTDTIIAFAFSHCSLLIAHRSALFFSALITRFLTSIRPRHPI